MYIYRITPTRPDMLSEGPTDEEATIAGLHFAYLNDLATDGIVLLAGRTQTTTPDSFGIIIFNAASDDEAWDIVENDPGVKHGVFHAELFPYKIAVLSEDIGLH